MHNADHYEMQSQGSVSNLSEEIQESKEIIKDIFQNNSHELSGVQKENFQFIASFRELLENIQLKIFKKARKIKLSDSKYSVTLISPSSLSAYCDGLKSLKNLGVSQEQLLQEITNAISCMNYTELSNCRINQQKTLQKIFFPFETYMSQKMMNIRNKLSENKFPSFLYQDTITAEEAAKNLLKLIQALKRFPMYMYVKNKIEKIHTNKLAKEVKLEISEQHKIDINYINCLITRLKNQANKLADISSTYLDRNTYKKLKKVSKNKYETRKNII